MEQKPLAEKTLEKTLEKPTTSTLEKPVEKPKVAYEYKGKVYEDEDVANYFKHEHFLYKVENKLLGEFDAKGKYVLPNELMKDLVALRKVVVKKEGQITTLKATSGSVTFGFRLETGVISKGESFAQLSLVEKASEVVGDEKIEIVSPIVFYTDDADAYFDTKVRKVFNILTDDDVAGGREKENDALALALLEKMKLMSKMYERFLLETRLRDKIYLEKLLRILAEDPNGTVILKKYEELIKLHQKVLDPASKNYYRILKQLLDQVLLEEEKSVSKEVAVLISRLRKVYVLANAQTIEGIKTPEVAKAPKKDEKIKMGSGPGQTVFKFTNPPSKPSAAKGKYNSMYANEQKKKEPTLDTTTVSITPTYTPIISKTLSTMVEGISEGFDKIIAKSKMEEEFLDETLEGNKNLAPKFLQNNESFREMDMQ